MYYKPHPIITDKCNSLPISKKTLLAIAGDHQRKLLVTIMQRSIDNGEASPHGCTYNTTHKRLREHHRKGGRKILRVREL